MIWVGRDLYKSKISFDTLAKLAETKTIYKKTLQNKTIPKVHPAEEAENR